MTTYYVSKTGNDGFNGLTTGTAWLTINHALTRALLPGDVVKIGAGTYTESVVMTAHGEAGADHYYDPAHWILITVMDGLSVSDVVVNGAGNRATFYLLTGGDASGGV